MLPDWTQAFLNTIFCTECREKFTAADILAIGVGKGDDLPCRSPVVALMILQCSKCAARMHVCGSQTLFEISEAVAAFYALHERGGGLEIAEPDPVNNLDHGGGLQKVKPSKRSGIPADPPSTAEIEEYLAILRRTSFKTNSKNFHSWARRMGINLMNPPWEEFNEQKEEEGGNG